MDVTRIIGALLLIPSIAFAECGFYREEQTMTIIVSKKSNKCFNSEEFRTAFRDDLVASVKVMNTETIPATVTRKKAATRARLAVNEATQKQPSLASAEYYGQKR